MIAISLDQFASIIGGTPSVGLGNRPIKGFATDNRHVKHGDVFIAIKGAKVDGADYAPEAVNSGAICVLTERPVDAPYILVESVVVALARFGKHMRDGFHGPVVGITGSAGKTTTKEFLAAALSPLGSILKTDGNRNTEYTSPLLWSYLSSETKAVVVEMAMRGFGQIEHLARISKPNIGLITNIGYSHLLQVGSREGIAQAKGELLDALPEDGIAVLWQEDDFFDSLKSRCGEKEIVTFGYSEKADCRVLGYQAVGLEEALVHGELFGNKWECRLPAVGRHLALNAASAVLVAHQLGIDVAEAAACIRSATLPPMRMETRPFRGGTLLLDNYNASPPSMIASIETLKELPVTGRRLAVIGEMRELGDQTEQAHRSVGDCLKASGIDEVVFVGEPMKFAAEQLSETPWKLAKDLEDVREFLKGVSSGDVILIKGSRALELERSLEGLE